MKIKYILFSLLSVSLLFSSCGETDVNTNEVVDWKERNIGFVDSLANKYDPKDADAELKAIIGTPVNNAGRQMEVYYKKYGNFYTDADSKWSKEDFPLGIKAILEKENGEKELLSQRPYQTSEIVLFYRGVRLPNNPSTPIKMSIPGFLTSAYKTGMVVFDENFDRAHAYPMIDFDLNLSATDKMLKGKVGDFVPGFSEMLQHMAPGDRVEVYIPYQYGYGKNDNKSMMGYTTLIFDLTLVEITKQ